MVSTRRTAANANRILADTKKPKVTEPLSDTINLKISPNKRSKSSLGASKPPANPPVEVLSGSISDHDINLTSPITDDISETSSMKAPTAEKSSSELLDRNASKEQIFATKPIAGTSGSCNDPIIVNENSSPPRPTGRSLKRKHPSEQSAEPHKFMPNGYRNLYNYYGVPRRALARVPTKRSMHNHHQSHDVHQMMNERATAEAHFNHNALQETGTSAFPFQAHHPLSAQTLAHQQISPSFLSSNAQYYQYPIPPVQHYTIISQSEAMLRKEALEYIRGFSRILPQKQTPSHTDPSERKSGEAGQLSQQSGGSKNETAKDLNFNPLPSFQIGTHVSSEPMVSQYLQPNLSIHYLTKHTSLLTSLLQIYPYSTDQKGVFEDIRALASIQNHHMTAWLDSISRDSYKQKQRSSDSTMNLNTHPRSTEPLQTTALSDKDRELRQVFSAAADMWQDGSGYNVADVFGT